jgi:putative oxygen-independent coproporphyrinogen III oxidase
LASASVFDLGIYLHFPWCRKLCPYCDFAVEVGEPPHERYLGAILRELDARAPAFAGELVSIYLGGGTPSLWRPDCIARALAAIRDRFGAPALREVTIEANPTDVTPATLDAWRAAGIDRISIGVQSLEPAELVVLGRDHRFGDGTGAIERALAHGGFAVSADFILGVPPGGPGRTPSALARIAGLPIDHVSVYELTIEDRTAFGRRVRDGRLVPLDEHALAQLYTDAHDALAGAGFEHYEISSYARPGRRAVHNARYWRGEPYLGLGVGAASLEIAPDGSAIRATNPRRAADYLAAPGAAAETTAIGAAEMAADRAWLGMRTSDGVAEAALAPARGVAEWLVGAGLAERRAGRICPTLRGFLWADTIAARIVQCWEGSDGAEPPL